MDIADQAEVRIEREMQAILDAHAAQSAGSTVSADLCEDCGLEISSARQVAMPGCTRCVECAGRAEQHARLNRRV